MVCGVRLRIGCSFDWEVTGPTPTVVHVEPRLDVGVGVVTEGWHNQPDVITTGYVDGSGNRCRRLVLPPGAVTLRYEAEVEVTNEPDPADPTAEEIPVERLPDEVLVYTLPSRYCLSDVLYDAAWERFGGTPAGWRRVQAVTDFVHGYLEFGYGSSTAVTTAVDAYESKSGVCRDFAHLAVTFCRALNIPARYCYGYLPDVGVEPKPFPMDFYAWTEVFLGGRWWTFDPRNNQRRQGRVLVGRGRDAVDVAMATTFGAPTLRELTVTAELAAAVVA